MSSESKPEPSGHAQVHTHDVVMYRVYKGTVQRVPLSIKSLNSHAIFLVILPDERQVIGWVGTDCDSADSELARQVGNTVMMKDFLMKEQPELPLIYENNEPNKLLEIMLDLLWSSPTSYFSKLNAADRKHKLTNNSVSVGLIEKITWGEDGGYDFQETAFAHPDNLGTVPRVTFVPIEINTVAYVNTGDQWDIWIARGVETEDEQNIISFVESSVIDQLALGSSAFKKDILSQYIKIVRQGEEHTLFRRPLKIFTDFEPPGRTAPRPEPLPKVRKERKKKAGSLQKRATLADDAGIAESKGGGDPSKSSGAGGGGDEDAPNPNALDFWAPPPGQGDTEDGDAHNNVSLLDMGDLAPRIDTSSKRFGGGRGGGGDEDALTGRDVNVVTAGMLKVAEGYNINPEQRRAAVEDAARNPSSLIGYQVRVRIGTLHHFIYIYFIIAYNCRAHPPPYFIYLPQFLLSFPHCFCGQIEIDEGVYAGVFVVARVKKTAIFKKTLFFLVGLDGDEFWVRLQRGKHKNGVVFRPNRRVVEERYIDYSKQCGSGANKKKRKDNGQQGEGGADAAPHGGFDGGVALVRSGSGSGSDGGGAGGAVEVRGEEDALIAM